MMVKLKSCRWKQEWRKYQQQISTTKHNNKAYIYGVDYVQISTDEEGDLILCQ